MDMVQAYEITHRSERYFRDLTESTNDILSVLRIDGTIEYENSAVERVLGYQALERHGRSVFDFIHPDDIPLTIDSIWAGMQEPGSVQRIEVRARHRNGHWVWLECVGSIKMEKAGPIVIVASRDITDRKRLQAGQADSETRIRNLVNSSPIIMFEFDRDGVYTLSEGGALEGLGRKPGESVGMSVEMVFQDVPDIPQVTRMALTGETATVELPVRRRWFRGTTAPIYDDSGEIVGAGGVAVDITELKAQQMFLHQLNRLLEMVALGSPRDEVLNELAATLEESIEDSACVIWTLTNGRLEPLATSGLPDTVAQELAKGVMAGPGLALWRLPGTGPEAVRSADLTSDDAWRNALAPMLAAGFVQVWSSPIVGDGAAVNAGIDVYHLANVDPGPVEEEYLRGASRVAQTAILRPSAGTAASGASARRAAATPRAGRVPVPQVAPKGRRRGKAALQALNLSEAQARILRLIARGLSNDEIARAVGLSPHTVKDYVSVISRSLGAKNRAHAVALSIDLGLV
jgi:PAS domain S-box-containing protein